MKPKHIKLLAKIESLGYKPTPDQSRTNPYTGRTVILMIPVLTQLYDFITTRKHTCGIDYTRQEWNTARMWFLELNPEAYYDLID